MIEGPDVRAGERRPDRAQHEAPPPPRRMVANATPAMIARKEVAAETCPSPAAQETRPGFGAARLPPLCRPRLHPALAEERAPAPEADERGQQG